MHYEHMYCIYIWFTKITRTVSRSTNFLSVLREKEGELLTEAEFCLKCSAADVGIIGEFDRNHIRGRKKGGTRSPVQVVEESTRSFSRIWWYCITDDSSTRTDERHKPREAPRPPHRSFAPQRFE
jgi:hypothetical protein